MDFFGFGLFINFDNNVKSIKKAAEIIIVRYNEG